MLDPKVKDFLIKGIDEQIEKALDQGDSELAAEYAAARKLVRRGCWKPRAFSPYIGFMEKCLVSTKGKTLKETQEQMQKCGAEWQELSPEEKEQFRKQKLDIYDFL